MNGKNINILAVLLLLALAFVSCEEYQEYAEDTLVYEPVGEHITISQLKAMSVDQRIDQQVYVQGDAITTDSEGNFSRQLFIQDETGAIAVNIDMGTYNSIYSKGSLISVQCKDLVLGDVGGTLQLCGSVVGSGIAKRAIALDNRVTRSHVFKYGSALGIEPKSISLSQVDSQSRAYEGELVTINDLFFQTIALPFANAGGSSSQSRTLYDQSGRSVLLSTNDGSTMASLMLPRGKGSVTGVLTYTNGVAQVMVSVNDNIVFDGGTQPEVNDPDDVVSPLFIAQYFSFLGSYYVQIYNSGSYDVDLSRYSLAADNQSDGNFSKTVALETEILAPGGMVVYKTSNANSIPWVDTSNASWSRLRTNYSAIRIDGLSLDGNSQVAIVRNSGAASSGVISRSESSVYVDVLSSTGKLNWAKDVTLVRRPNVEGHSKSSDFTRADAGWITRVGGYNLALGYHKFHDSDPDLYLPGMLTLKSILEIRVSEQGLIAGQFKAKGRVTSDRVAGNVAANRLFMQDNSNRGICIAFREGQSHDYNPGDEIEVDIYGSTLVSENGLLMVKDATFARSHKTESAPQMPDAIEASVSQISTLQSMYVYIKDVQVKSSALLNTYGAGAVESEDLFANAFSIYSLPSASFAMSTVAQGSGTVKGIATIDGGVLRIMPRNAADLTAMTLNRFVAITATPITVAQLRAKVAGTITENVRVSGTVVSDFSGGNYMSADCIFVQDAETGFLLQLPATNNYLFGQSLIVVLKNALVATTDGKFVVTPASVSDIVAVGAPDPAFEPAAIDAGKVQDNLFKLVTLLNIQVSEADRLKRLDGTILFDTSTSPTAPKMSVITSPTAEWKGGYIPMARGSVTGLLTRNGTNLELYPRKTADLSGLPTDGLRLDGEKVVYFTPSTDANADLFISKAIMGNLDINGKPISTIARNNCNAKFVELFNPTANGIDLSNYRVACVKYNNSLSRGGVEYYQFPEETMLTPGRTVVFKYLSTAMGTVSSSPAKQTNTIWPKTGAADAAITSGVVVSTTAVPGVIVCFDARDYSVTIANSTKSFASFDGNDILVVQKLVDGNWIEIDRLFSLRTANNTIGGSVSYPYLSSYYRKAGKLGLPGIITDVADAGYTAGGKNVNDFSSTQCDPDTGGADNWIRLPVNSFDDLGVHVFSTK